MNVELVVNALYLAVACSVPFLAAIVAGAVLSGLVRGATQIDDPVVSLVGRLMGLGLVLYVKGPDLVGEVVKFAARVWGGSDFYG